MRCQHLLLVATVISFLSLQYVTGRSISSSSSSRRDTSINHISLNVGVEQTLLTRRNIGGLLLLRGGDSSDSSSSGGSAKKKKKKSKSKKKKSSSSSSSSSSSTTLNDDDGENAKKAIDEAMKEKDAAEALGDAIRDRADVLREEDPLLQSIGWSMSSVGQALGASDRRMAILNDGGGVEAATSSVLANYFLKSHGGAHALQCLCSSLATLSALGAIVLRIGYSVGSAAAATDDGGSNAKNVIAFTLLRRTMIFAMIKHVSGLLASASVAAKAIPKIGLTQARQWMEQIVIDPVSQYVFYTALLLLWLPPKQRLAVCWWWKHKWTIPILTGPILLREIISNILVISDILVLWSTADSNASSVIEPFLKISQSTINAVMSVVTTADVWRNADPATRQAILGKLVSRISLVLEVIVGILLLTDVVWGFVEMAFSPGGAGGRPSLRYTLTRFLCVRLYIHFLWIRRKKISQLALKIRGGASKVPFRVCDIVYDPIKAMGLDPKTFSVNYEKSDSWTWRDYLLVGLGLDQ